MRTLNNAAAICLSGWLAVAGAQLRDPFAPQPDVCATNLSQTEYRGYVATDEKFIALILRPQGQWQRWIIDSQPEPGWRVAKITANSLELNGPTACAPLRLSRYRQGEISRDETKRFIRATRHGDSLNRDATDR